MNTLVVCEKFSLAQDIAAALGCPHRTPTYFENRGSLRIIWLDGHMTTLAPPEYYDPKWEDRSFFPIRPVSFVYLPRNQQAVRLLKAHTENLSWAQELVNACDAGREGEAIFWEWYDQVGAPKLSIQRLWLHSNTTDGIKAAWGEQLDGKSPKLLALAKAAKVRGQADWLLGINGSRAVTALLGGRTWSIGRVQTAILGLIYARERAIRTHVQKPYYSLYARFVGQDGYEARVSVPPGFTRYGKFAHIFANDSELDAVDGLLKRTGAEIWSVKDISEEQSIYPPPLFDLVGLERFCAHVLGWSSSRTLAAAQDAYSTYRIISYPRTDSTFLPEDFQISINGLYKQIWNQVSQETDRLGPFSIPDAAEAGLAKHFPTFNNDKVSDHYAIIPTGVTPPEDGGDALVVWRVIARRTLVHFFPVAKYVSFLRETFLSYTLRSPFAQYRTGETLPLHAVTTVDSLTVPGWIPVAEALGHPMARTIPTARKLPVAEPEGVRFDKSEVYQGFTEPPDPFDEDSLLGALARLGLGTPATQAGMIDTLLSRGYIKRYEGKPPKLRITPDGELLIRSLHEKSLQNICQPDTTAEWELQLKRMEDMDVTALSPQEFLNGVYELAEDLCEVAKEGDSAKVYCPISKKLVAQKDDKYVFPGVPFPLPVVLAKRPMTAREYRDVIKAKKPCGPFEGFISKMGKPFSAKLVYDPALGKITFSYK